MPSREDPNAGKPAEPEKPLSPSSSLEQQREEALRRHAAVLAVINRVLEMGLGDETEEEMCRACLGLIEEVTGSAISFIGEIRPYGLLQALAISNPSWDACEMRDTSGHRRAPGSFAIHGIYGRVLTDGKSLIVNDPASHPDSIGLPEGHPALTSFMGVPLLQKGETVGMIAVGNREGGYRIEDREALEMMAPAVTQAIFRKRDLATLAANVIEHAQAEQALRMSEARMRAAIAGSAGGRWDISADEGQEYGFGDVADLSSECKRFIGFADDEFPSSVLAWRQRIHPDDLPAITKAASAHIEGRAPYYSVEYRIRHKDGSWRYLQTTGLLQRDSEGRPLRWTGIDWDITERKKTEEALREGRARYQNLIETTSDFIWEVDPQGRYTYCSPQMETLWGLKPEEMIGRTPFDQMPPGPREQGIAFYLGMAKSKRPFSGIQVPSLDGRGRLITIEISGVPFFDDRGELSGYRGITRDVTERERTQRELASREALLRALTDNSPDAIYVKDTQSRWLMANPAVLRLVGRTAEEALGKTDVELYGDPAIGKAILENDRRVMEGKGAETFEELADTSAGRRLFLSTKAPWFDSKGDLLGLIGISRDVTESRRAEELRQALADQEKLRLGAAVEQASDSIAMVDLDGTIRYVNGAFEAINKIARQAAIGTSYFDILDVEPSVAEEIREAIAAGRPWRGMSSRLCADGRPVELEVTISSARDASGKVIGGLITAKDVTRENALQSQVRQAQKMEALGTLAGGITHDFNNILGAIILNTELALLDLDPMDPARRPLPLVLQAATRGKELVKQIITFSRQRTWEKKPARIAPIVSEGMKLLRATLPKDVSIQETIDPASGVVLVDPSHIHQVLVNLCQNAALAMRAGGGRLEVALAPVEIDEAMALRYPSLSPGPYVRLTVADSGCGMTKEIQERIFEPFFTTRAAGEGSGLGLAVVHGIVRTYDGEITVASEPTKGSSFSVYFPRVEGEGPAAGAERHEEPQRGEERILLVEDEEAQRRSFEEGLGRLGYRVTARADGRSALGLFRGNPAAFDIVITDQIMPQMTGLELAFEITALRPGLPVIMCTGFSEKVNEESVARSGVRELLMKPFTLLEATRLIRKVLA